MNPVTYNPKFKRQDSPSPLLPTLFQLKSPVFPNFHSSFLRKNNQLKKIGFSSFDIKPDLQPKSNISNISNNMNETPIENIRKIKDSTNRINEVFDNNKKFQSNPQWNFKQNKSNMKWSLHEKFDFKEIKQRNIIPTLQKKTEDLENVFPSFVTKNTVESANNIQKRINFLKEQIKKKDLKFRKYNPKHQVKKERVYLKDLGQSAKEVHYLVFDFEKDTEDVLIRISRGKSSGHENKNKDEYGDFRKRHNKHIIK